jgi:hypothetical protein
MKLERDVARKLLRDIVISLFIYALPVVLMLCTFYITGKRPWKDKPTPITIHQH